MTGCQTALMEQIFRDVHYSPWLWWFT